ncbi:hypothetical protein ABZ020_13825, partial [Streptomyces sp. NPDC006355]
SVAGKAGRVIDPMTYIAKGAGAGLSKIGDITKNLRGVGNIDIPALPENAVTLPEGTVKLPDGTVQLPEGAALPDGATKLPDGNVRLPEDAPVLPEGTTKLPTEDGAPARYYDPDGNILDEHGNVLQKSADGPGDVVDQPHLPDTPAGPAQGADTPRVDSPAQQPALVGAGTHTAEQAGQAGQRLGNSLDDVGRVNDDVPATPTVQASSDMSSVHAGGDLPSGGAGDHLPTGHAGDNLPSGRADDVTQGPSASHGPPASHTGGHSDAHHGAGDNGHTSSPRHEPSPNGLSDHPTVHHQDAHSGNHDGGLPGDSHPVANHGGDGAGHQDHGSASPDAPHSPGYPDGYDPTDALVHEGSLPGVGPGDKFLGQMDPSRVETANGLITHVDGRPVEKFIQSLSRDRVDIYMQAKNDGTFPKTQTGACVGSVIDTRTGLVYEGINGPADALIPLDDLHPTLAERYEAIESNPPHPAPILQHAEVKAANRLLWERRKLGLPDGPSALSELRASVWFPFKKDFDLEIPVPPKAAPFCANCANMLHEVPSSFGRFTGFPPNAQNKLPW